MDVGYCREYVHRRVYTTFLYDSILNWVKTIVDADQTYGPVGSGIGQTCKRCCALVGIGAYCQLLLIVIKCLIAISHGEVYSGLAVVNLNCCFRKSFI